MAKLPALAAALLLNSPSALACGGLGHETICELAFRELDVAAMVVNRPPGAAAA